MGKSKNLIIGAAALGLAVLTCTGTSAGELMRNAAYASAGLYSEIEQTHEPAPDNSSLSGNQTSEISETSSSEPFSESVETSPPEESSIPGEKPRGEIITVNRTNVVDDEDYSVYTARSGEINRYNIGKLDGIGYINLESGAQVRNNTDIPNETLIKALDELPEFHKNADIKSPRVLIYHTHSNESFLPKADWFDEDYPIISPDCSKNMIAVGDALCKSLAENGISVVHECRMHDYPIFTGAYYRSAESIIENLEKYPDIDIVIDLHRDGFVNSDGSLGAPVCEVNGKTAAQFMIISCCENEDFDMPDYIENFKLACLLQDTAGEMYPGLSRPVLFDYRNYNQELSKGALLIEVGSQGNSLDEAVYTGELLGNVIAKALTQG